MLTKTTFKFLSDLSKNNNKDWFDKNKQRYIDAQNEIKSFLADWIATFGKKDTSIAHLEPKKCVFRIHRDVRFSKDKSPYKTNLGAYITKGGKNLNLAGYYLHIQPGACFFAAGNYMPMPEQLAKIRQEIDYNFVDFKKIIQAKKFNTNFGDLSTENKLIRPPKGYDESNEAIEYLKLKGFTIYKNLSDEEITSKDFVKNITELCVTAMPFIDFLNNAVD
ncbi:MAG: DUF2461 domain-containing protein [Chitinophagales bacterium]